jgi:hypothetical protein
MAWKGTLITLDGANAIFDDKAKFESVVFAGKTCGYRAIMSNGIALESTTLVKLCRLVLSNLK